MTGKKPSEPDPVAEHSACLDKQALEYILNALRGLRFGQVTVVVQDGVIVQVERTERVRPPRSSSRRQ